MEFFSLTVFCSCSIHALEDGTVYKGSFVNMYRHGEGELTFPNGDAYKGTFEVSFFGFHQKMSVA